MTGGIIEVLATTDQGQVLRLNTNRDWIRCFECQEYIHFARDCLTMQVDREVVQIQQMFNMEEEQTLLQIPLINTNQARQSANTIEAREHLKV